MRCGFCWNHVFTHHSAPAALKKPSGSHSCPQNLWGKRLPTPHSPYRMVSSWPFHRGNSSFLVGRMKHPGGRGPCPGSHKSSLSTGSGLAGTMSHSSLIQIYFFFFMQNMGRIGTPTEVTQPNLRSKFTQPYCLWALRSQESAQGGSCRLSLAQRPYCRCLRLKGGGGGGAGEISICQAVSRP